jgi:hypothetical protein
MVLLAQILNQYNTAIWLVVADARNDVLASVLLRIQVLRYFILLAITVMAKYS